MGVTIHDFMKSANELFFLSVPENNLFPFAKKIRENKKIICQNTYGTKKFTSEFA